MAVKEEVVKAEVIDDGQSELARLDEGAITASFGKLQALVLNINDALAEGNRAVEELYVDDEQLAAMSYEDVKRFATELNLAWTKCEDARKAFNGEYDTPKKRVKLAYDAAIQGIAELRDRYKAQAARTESEIKQRHWDNLNTAYVEFMDSNGLAELGAAVPLEKFAERKWWDTTAKNYSEKAAENKMIKRATEIVADWRSVKQSVYHFPELAEGKFLETLSLREVNENDAMLWGQKQTVDAIAAEFEEATAFRDCEPAPEIVSEAEQVVAEVPSTYVLCVDMTPAQYEALIAWFKANGVHGVPLRTAFNGWQQASSMVKAVCNE